MNEKLFSFLVIFFFALCLSSIPASADLENMLNQLEKMGKKLDSLGEKKAPSPIQSRSNLKKSLTNKSLLFNWYLKRAGKKDSFVTNQYVYFGKKGKMWGLFFSKEKGSRTRYDYAVSGKWKIRGGKVCIEHNPMFAMTHPSWKLITKPARQYCYDFPKTGFADISFQEPRSGFRTANQKIRSFIIPTKNPDKYKKYHLVAEFGVSTKRNMTFRRKYKHANKRVTKQLAKNKKNKQRAQKRKKEEMKEAEEKAMRKARAKQEMSTLSSFKNARGKWGVKFGMTKRQVGASSKICKYHHNTTDPKYSSVFCSKELFGVKRSIYLSYTKNKVSGITVNLGKHTYSEWTKLHKILSRKYKVNYKATMSDKEMYTNQNTSRYFNLYDNGRIVLQVSRACAKWSRGRCLWKKNVTKLVYWDDIQAKAFMKLIKKRSKKEDL